MHPLTTSFDPAPPAPVVLQALSRFGATHAEQHQPDPPPSEEHIAIVLSRLLNHILRPRLRCPELIEEIRQETMLRVLVRIRQGRVREPERLSSFAFGVCHRVLCERLRSERRYVPAETETVETVDDRADPNRPLAEREQREYVARIMALLSTKDRDILRLTFMDGMSRADVCDRLGVERARFRVMLHRAKRRFRKAAQADSAYFLRSRNS